MLVRVTGLDAADYQLGATQLSLPPAGHESVLLSVSDKLPHGVHRLCGRRDRAGLARPVSDTASFRIGAPPWTKRINPRLLSGSVQSQWGKADAEHFGYESDEERKSKRGLEDWELVEKIPESQKPVPYWFFAVVCGGIAGWDRIELSVLGSSPRR